MISIIVPVYNVEKYLRRCIDSILNQSFKDYEVILVDDGSKDISGKICDEYASMYKNLKVIHKENGGLGYARNTGLEYASGEYILFVDSDDYLEASMIENLYTCLISNKADTCIGGFKRVGKNKVDIHENYLSGKVFKGEDIKSEVLARMLGKRPNGKDSIEMSVWKVLFSNSIIKKYNLKFPSERELISEDIVFDLEYYSKSKCVCISSDTGYCYCDNEGSLTTRYRPERFMMQTKLYKYLKKRTKELGIYELCNERIATTLMSNIRYCIKLEVKFKKNQVNCSVRKRINMICNDDTTKEVISNYAMSQVPLKSRVVNYAIKYKLTTLLYIIMRIKNRYYI